MGWTARMTFFLKGLIVGLSIAAPVGPIGILCIRRTLALTLTNPTPALSFAAIFAGLGVAAGARYISAASLVAGVFCGSALWWLSLSTAVCALRHHLSPSGVLWVSRASGAIIAGFGVQALV